MRPIIVYLAIVALLMCPYDCAVKFAAAQSPGNDDHGACCEKCLARQLSESPPLGGERLPVEQGPSQPAPSEDGKSCLCEGAVFDATNRSPAAALLELSHLSWAADSAFAPTAAAHTPSVDGAGASPSDAGGRLTRIAIRSLLL